jgi:murein L,D-transpeptidase YcbB/YkuD
MKIWMLAGAACAAVTAVTVPASAATPPLPSTTPAVSASADQAVSGFYAARRGAPLWLRAGGDSSAAREMIGILQRAPLDGLASGPALAAEAQSLISRAQSGDLAALANAERLLSTAWVLYVQALQTPPAGMTYADSWVAPRRHTPGQILAAAAGASSLAGHVRSTAAVNPLYAQLRDAAYAAGAVNDPRVQTNLDRLRAMPFQKRYVMVDAASAQLYMIEDGRIADSMKVIVGKATSQTPMLASTIYRATLNPYWNVPGDLVRSLIAPRVADQGVGYLKAKGYEVLSSYDENAVPVDAAKVDWRAVAEGREVVKVRQRPGAANSMGQVKFSFPNGNDIFLHDTPNKELFAASQRDLSNGCIRLEDAQRLGRWLVGHDARSASADPEQHVLLPTPVPIYITYLTAKADGSQLAFVSDVYGLDSQRAAQVAALR